MAANRDVVLYEGEIPQGQVKVIKDKRILNEDNLDVILRANDGTEYLFHDTLGNGTLAIVGNKESERSDSDEGYVKVKLGNQTIKVEESGNTEFSNGADFSYSRFELQNRLDREVRYNGRKFFDRADSLYAVVMDEVAKKITSQFPE